MKAALITGGAKRLGREMALALAKMGCPRIAIHYHSSEEAAYKLLEELKLLGTEGILYKADLSDAAEVERMAAQVFNDMPELDLLINNASIFRRSPLKETSTELLESSFKVNFEAPYILTRQFATLSGRGNIINILDTKVAKNGFLYSAYTLSKQALHHLTLQSARELAPEIRVNGICPGLVLPPDGQDEAIFQRMAVKQPLQEPGSPTDIIKGLTFLLESGYVTGQTLYIDGGQHL